MTSRTPSACDDPREHGFPCFGSQKPASWVTCTKCGARLQYVSKNSQHGNRRQMGPEPHLIKLAMVDLEMSTPAASVTSDMVNGKLMETKGRMLQWAIPTSIALKCPEHGMTHAQYMEQLKENGPADHPKIHPSAPSHGLSPEQCEQQQPSIPSSGSGGGTGSSEPATCHSDSKCKVSGCEESPKSDSQGASQEGEADHTRADGDPLQRQRGTFGSAWKALNDLKKRMKEVASAVTSSKQACDEPMTQEQCDTTKKSKTHKNGIMFSGLSQRDTNHMNYEVDSLMISPHTCTIRAELFLHQGQVPCPCGTRPLPPSKTSQRMRQFLQLWCCLR